MLWFGIVSSKTIKVRDQAYGSVESEEYILFHVSDCITSIFGLKEENVPTTLSLIR